MVRQELLTDSLVLPVFPGISNSCSAPLTRWPALLLVTSRSHSMPNSSYQSLTCFSPSLDKMHAVRDIASIQVCLLSNLSHNPIFLFIFSSLWGLDGHPASSSHPLVRPRISFWYDFPLHGKESFSSSIYARMTSLQWFIATSKIVDLIWFSSQRL